MQEWIQKIAALFEHNGISAWLYAPAIAVLWFLVLLLAKRLILRHADRLARLTAHQWDDLVLKSISLPITLVILGSAIALAGKFLPLAKKWAWMTGIAFKISILAALVLALDRFLVRVLDVYSAKVSVLRFSPGMLKGIIRGILLGLGALVLLDMIGVSITPFLASLGIGSLAVALGLQNTLSNLFAGMQVMVDKSIQLGDYVKLDSEVEGYITEIGWRATKIRKLSNNTVIIPNGKLVGAVLTNYYLPTKDLAVLVEVGVHYSSDLKKVEEVTIQTAREVLKTVPGGVTDFEPFIRYHTFADSSINFTVILRAREYVDQYLLKHEFIKALHKRFAQEGIVIPFPIRSLDIPPETLASLNAITHSK